MKIKRKAAISFCLALTLILGSATGFPCFQRSVLTVQAASGEPYFPYENQMTSYPLSEAIVAELETYPYYLVYENESTVELHIYKNELVVKSIDTSTRTIQFDTNISAKYTWDFDSQTWTNRYSTSGACAITVTKGLGGNVASTLTYNGTKVFNTQGMVAENGELGLTEGSEQTTTTPSAFTVDEPVIGMGVTVGIPAYLNVCYDEANDTFRGSYELWAKGDVKDYMEVVVQTPSKITYKNQNPRSSYALPGYIKMGVESGSVLVESWKSHEMIAGEEDEINLVKKPITVEMPIYNASESGTYEGTLEFDITLAVVGQYQNLCLPTSKETLHNGSIPMSASARTLSFNANTTYKEAFNLSNAKADFSPDKKMCINRPVVTSDILRYVQMADDIYYASNVSNIETTMKDSYYQMWLLGQENVSVIIIPSTITTAQLQCNNDGDSVDFATTTFKNSEVVIGNALAFVKNFDEENRFIYVPHIVYQGTKSEWMALSGKDNWTFGNMSNIVTVHCTDGNLIYQ